MLTDDTGRPEFPNICLKVSYDGTNFAGFQIQTGNIPTVQGVLETALSRVYKQPLRVAAAGRTDAGVHALGQVVSYQAPFYIPAGKLPPAINSLLPPEVVVWEAEEKPTQFHARFSARKKIYSYTLDRAPFPQVMKRRYTWYCRYTLNTEAISKGGAWLAGRHDFSAFRARGSSTGSAVRTLYRISVDELPGQQLLRITFEGDGFLYKMVRLMVGSLIRVGRGRLQPEDLGEALAGSQPQAAGPAAPPQGLCLEKVEY